MSTPTPPRFPRSIPKTPTSTTKSASNSRCSATSAAWNSSASAATACWTFKVRGWRERNWSRRVTRLGLTQQGFHFPAKCREAGFQHAPHDPVGYICVGVNQSVPEGNDLPAVGDLTGQAGIEAQGLPERFSDDLKLTLNGRPQHGIPLVIGKRLASGEAFQEFAGLSDAKEVFANLTPQHRDRPESLRWPSGSRDCESARTRPSPPEGGTASRHLRAGRSNAAHARRAEGDRTRPKGRGRW